MTRNRLTSGLSADQLRQYNSLTDATEQKLFLESLDVIDLTATPTPDQAAHEHPLPTDFLPGEATGDLADTWEQLLTNYSAAKDKQQLRDMVSQLLRQQQYLLQQQTDTVQQVISPLVQEQQVFTLRLEEISEATLKKMDVERVIRQQVAANLQDVPAQLNGAVEEFVKNMVPAVVRVENPSDALLRLTHYLTAGLVVSGLGLGGLFFWGLTRQARLSEQTPGWMKYQYLSQKAQASEDRKLLNYLAEAERLHQEGKLVESLSHLGQINAARRQQQHFRQEEKKHQRELNQPRP